SSAGSPFIGLAFGLILVHHTGHKGRLVRWSVISAVLIVAGVALNFAGFPFNKNLYSTSYLLLTAGFGGGLLSVVYAIVDITKNRWAKYAFMPFIMMVCWIIPC